MYTCYISINHGRWGKTKFSTYEGFVGWLHMMSGRLDKIQQIRDGEPCIFYVDDVRYQILARLPKL